MGWVVCEFRRADSGRNSSCRLGPCSPYHLPPTVWHHENATHRPRAAFSPCVSSSVFPSPRATRLDPAPESRAEIAPPVITARTPSTSPTRSFPMPNRGGLEARLGGGENFANAAIRVGAVTTIVGLNWIIPKAVTAARPQRRSVRRGRARGSGRTRSASTQQDATFRLAGTPDGTEIEWSMQVTATDPETGEVYDDFELYTAQTAFDGASVRGSSSSRRPSRCSKPLRRGERGGQDPSLRRPARLFILLSASSTSRRRRRGRWRRRRLQHEWRCGARSTGTKPAKAILTSSRGTPTPAPAPSPPRTTTEASGPVWNEAFEDVACN